MPGQVAQAWPSADREAAVAPISSSDGDIKQTHHYAIMQKGHFSCLTIYLGQLDEIKRENQTRERENQRKNQRKIKQN